MNVFQKKPTFIVHRIDSLPFQFGGGSAQREPLRAVDWIEIDVRRTKDGMLVVFHDELVSTGERAGSLSHEELDRLGVRSFRHFMNKLPPNLNVVIDVKNSIDDATAARTERTWWLVVEAIREVAEGRSILLTSFDPSVVVRAHEQDDSLRVGLTTWQGVPLRESIPTAAVFGIDVLGVHIDALRPYGIELGDSKETITKHVEMAHRIELQLACWGGEQLSRSDVEYLIELGIDAIYVDEQNMRLVGQSEAC